jgi:hypothetical protein
VFLGNLAIVFYMLFLLRSGRLRPKDLQPVAPETPDQRGK